MQIDIILVFFIYGLAFFTMGIVMLLESSRSPILASTRALLLLAAFGLLHGSHEWLELVLVYSGWFSPTLPIWIGWMRIVLLTISFASLALFGIRLLQPQRRLSARDIFLVGALLAIYSVFVILVGLSMRGKHADWMRHLDGSVRYLLAVPAAILAGITLHLQASQVHSENLHKLGNNLRWAAWGFIFYAATQAVVPPSDTFPANLLNTATFFNWFGFPIQAIRAVLAIVITISLLRAVYYAEEQRKRQLIDIQKSRLEALEQVQKELIAREKMRQQLLRHTVIAQEEERARIARELHDETAQVLTAFTLHLAELQSAVSGNLKANEHVQRMQLLSHQMSEEISRLIHDLRPVQLDDLGIVAALQYLASESNKRTGLDVRVEVKGELVRLDPQVETVLFRVTQEALTNIIRHSGVNQAAIQLKFEPQQVSLLVSDHGVGFEPSDNRMGSEVWGHAGMRERTEAVNGELIIQSSPGVGTTVEVLIPYNNSVRSTSDNGVDQRSRSI
ncbi:histidine kinase [Chloroflexota bacterium]